MSDKVLVDTSVWIAFFRSANSEGSTMVKQLLRTGSPAYTGIIATELYRGAKSKKETSVLDDLLTSIECLPVRDEYFKAAGELGYVLSQHGITVGTVDLLIAEIAIANKAAIFTFDAHFASIARYSSLRVYR